MLMNRICGSVLVALLVMSTVAQADPLFFSGTGHFYEFIATQRSWQNAREDAASRSHQGMPGYLATITSASENEFIKGFSQRGWLGGSDIAQEGVWLWNGGPEEGLVFWNGGGNGGPPTGAYANFEIGEPNNQGAGEHGLFMWGPSDGDGSSWGKWNDFPPTDLAGYWVEYSPVPEPATLGLLIIAGFMQVVSRPRKSR